MDDTENAVERLCNELGPLLDQVPGAINLVVAQGAVIRALAAAMMERHGIGVADLYDRAMELALPGAGDPEGVRVAVAALLPDASHSEAKVPSLLN